ncbi:Eco57I restriction-modification methylase domain-containing protein [uncultured Fusobacterium sp.]|uniref:Eco57I restriction-modification methylase domain-containing protein n=1 Tax=uncultured Fusobacterium sp. TaxID=159267 RepID=UPI0025EAF9BD|nr:Eco57I restriction-modification methylase domain-containing protein [uncultured Fusobacterium sp.]
MNNNHELNFKNTFNYKVIYIFTINDDIHKGLVKIGDATLQTKSTVDILTPNCKELNQAALKRIKSYTNTAGITPILLHTELAIKEEINKEGFISLKAFRDYEVHKVLENSNISKEKIKGSSSREWYKISKETAIEAIQAVKKQYSNLSNSKVENHPVIIFRPEQKEAIEKTVKQFKHNKRMLWNAKMRFGKTLSTLEVIKRCQFKKTIIVCHRPVVNSGWYDDFKKIFYDDSNYIYGSKLHGYSVEELENTNKNYIYFSSVQDLRGSKQVGGKFDKNSYVFQNDWDCVVIDEAHEGTTTKLGLDTLNELLNNSKTKLLSLSGTPFNILDDYDEENSIYTWDYIMEQECKLEWDKLHFGDSNPYEELPELRIYTYNLGDLLHNNYLNFEDKAFNFSEFFRTWTGEYRLDYTNMPDTANIGDFVHEQDIISFLNLMTNKDEKNNYPFSSEEYRNLFKHSLWMVPGVKEAKALKNLMLKHKVFGNGQFDIINVAGNDDEEAIDALNSVKNAIKKAEELDTYTITLSCGKLTTGVTVKEWTAVFMLSGSSSTSAANYLQTIFRVQSPCNKNGMIKDTAYVFDFAPDRTLKMVSEAVSVSNKAGKLKSDDKKILGKFLNYCPVISISGSQMKEYKADKLLQQLKKAYADKVVRNGFDDNKLYNDELLKLNDLDIEKFNNLKGIIGKSKAAEKSNDIPVNEQGLTNEEYEEQEKLKNKNKKELSEEDKARLEELKKKSKIRNDAISILRGISIRMPLLIYGANVPYDEEITLDRFIEEVDDSSWNEFMPTGVTKEIFKEFKKYYDEDIFIAAGRKIRSVTHEADILPPTERVKKIATLFSSFKNPDKETVLTPWRVVNMHMSDCLGGFNFWDEKFNFPVEEPYFVDRGKITNETLANTSSKILEINSKTGLYPLYITYSIFKMRCKKISEEELSLDIQQKLWNETIKNNIFIICKTPMAKQITQRTLAGYSTIKTNAHYFDDLVNQLKNKAPQFIERILNSSYWKKGESGKMKFDAIVGNPPYQEENSNTRKPPLYHYFYDMAFKLSDIVTLITPARFLFNIGQTPKSWNEKMLNDEHFKVINYFSDSKSIFDTVDIKGGVVITLHNTKENYGKIKVFTPFKELNEIMKKIELIDGENYKSICDITSSRGNYRFTKDFLKQNPFISERLGNGTGDMIVSNVFEKLPEIFTETKTNEKDYKFLGRNNNERVYRYISRDFVQKNPYLNTYNVILPKSNGTGAFGEILSTPLISNIFEGATDTFISIGLFETKIEANAMLKYIKTKFLRALLGIKKATQDNPKSVWQYIPIQDFTKNSDIDWNKSISEIDGQLYEKYNLNDDEISFIEERIKAME